MRSTKVRNCEKRNGGTFWPSSDGGRFPRAGSLGSRRRPNVVGGREDKTQWEQKQIESRLQFISSYWKISFGIGKEWRGKTVEWWSGMGGWEQAKAEKYKEPEVSGSAGPLHTPSFGPTSISALGQQLSQLQRWQSNLIKRVVPEERCILSVVWEHPPL